MRRTVPLVRSALIAIGICAVSATGASAAATMLPGAAAGATTPLTQNHVTKAVIVGPQAGAPQAGLTEEVRHRGRRHRRFRRHRNFRPRHHRRYNRRGGGGIYFQFGIPGPRIVAPPPRRYYRGGLSRSHYIWCDRRYRSYRARDNTFQPYNGPRRQCRSPYG